MYYDKDGKEIKRVKANTSTYAANRPHVLQSSITPSPTTVSYTHLNGILLILSAGLIGALWGVKMLKGKEAQHNG